MEIAIRQVKAFTVRLEFPLSRTKKSNPLASDPTIMSMTVTIKILVNIWYTSSHYVKTQFIRQGRHHSG